MSKKTRKPLRRTAWSMVLGGLGVAAIMLTVGAYTVSKGSSAGPDQPATWPAGAEITVERPFGRQQDNAENAAIVCTVTPQDGQPKLIFPIWQERMHPDFTGPATITCRQPVKIITEPAITIAIITRGPLIALPLVSAGLGAFLFFPRFTALAASLSHPFGRLVTRLTGRDRNPLG